MSKSQQSGLRRACRGHTLSSPWTVSVALDFSAEAWDGDFSCAQYTYRVWHLPIFM
jgi:hypothetical protein